MTKSKLRTRTLTDLVRSLRTSLSVTKLCDVDKAVREYLLYVLLDDCLHAGERVNVPVDLRKQEYTEQQWAARGKELAGTQAKKFRLPVKVTGQLAGTPAVVQQKPELAMQDVDVKVVGAVLNVARAVCVAIRAGREVARGVTVTSVAMFKDVESMSKRVEKLRTVPRVPGSQYLKVGIDNYLLWAMYNSGSSYTLLSTGFCKELGLTVNQTRSPGSYQVADRSLRKFAGRLELQVLQLHNDLAQTVENIAVVESEEPQFLIGQDTLSHKGSKHIRCTGTCAEPGGAATMQLEVGKVRSGVLFNLPLHTLPDDAAFAGPNSDGACMTIMATSLVEGAPLEEVLFRAEQADQLRRWLQHHDMSPDRVVRAFLTARSKGADVVCLTCPQCRKYLLDMDPTALAEPQKRHTCGHCLHVLTEELPVICNSIAGFQPIVGGGKLALASEDFVQRMDADLAGPKSHWTRG